VCEKHFRRDQRFMQRARTALYFCPRFTLSYFMQLMFTEHFLCKVIALLQIKARSTKVVTSVEGEFSGFMLMVIHNVMVVSHLGGRRAEGRSSLFPCSPYEIEGEREGKWKRSTRLHISR
jgi:hypothetical protein